MVEEQNGPGDIGQDGARDVEPDGEQDGVTRSVEVEASAEEVWAAVADPAQRAAWLDDPDAAGRTVRVDRAEEGRRLVWTWWRSEGDEPDASTVEIALRPLDGGGTRVVVTETPLVSALGGRASATTGPVSPGPVPAMWELRLLGLELLFVAARTRLLL